MNLVRSVTLTALAGSIAMCFGCGGSTTTTAATPEMTADATPAPQARRAPTNVSLREDVAQTCKIPAPQFAFDSADVQPNAEQPLAALAECFKSGPLAGRKMVLIGATDPRGDADYNIALGQQRAHAVSETLQAKGLPPDQIATMSVGEFYADGYDEATWADDRRVEVGVQAKP